MKATPEDVAKVHQAADVCGSARASMKATPEDVAKLESEQRVADWIGSPQ